MMKRLLLALLFASSAYAQSYSTNFPLTQNPISESGNWINGGTVGLDWGNVQTSTTPTNRAFGVSLPSQFGDPTAVLTGSWSSNQSATATVRIVTAVSPVAHEVELRLRTTITAHSITGYEINCSVVTASPYIQIVRWNGPVANFTQLDQNGSIACVNGDVLAATITGGAGATQIQVTRNGTPVTFSNCNCTTVVDTSGITTGSPGIGFYDNQDGLWGNFGFSTFSATGSTTATCSQADMTAAITAASPGATVTVPAGNCSWTSLNLAKNVTLNGSGQGVTNITLPNASAFNITKQVAGPTRIQNMTFSCSVKVVPHVITVSGPWPTGQPVIFQNDTFTSNGCDWLTAFTPGGVIFANDVQNGILGDTLYSGKDTGNTGNSWGVADSIGNHDTTGFYNSYIETNTLNGGSVTDCDDGCRVVMRFNIGNESGGFNSHGLDTSAIGMRHFEIYNNQFFYPDKTCPPALGVNAPANINQWIWIRGGTGVIYNNQMEPLFSQCWGDKNEWKFAIRYAEDASTCSTATYPAPHQLGQNFNGTSLFTDPIYIWGNTSLPGTNPVSPGGIDPGGTLAIAVQNGWQFGNACSKNWNTFFQWGRDAVNTTLGTPVMPAAGGIVEGTGGTPKPGYVAFTYPHPLVGGTSPALTFSPNPLAFGNQNIGTTSTSRSITISNVGSASEAISTNILSGADFSDVSTGAPGQCVNGGSIAAGSSCTRLVNFHPTTIGAKNGTLTVNGTVTAGVTLSGTGTNAISIPSVPTGLTTLVSGSTVNLSWTASTGSPTGYNVLRGTVNGGPYTTIATLGTVTTYADTGRPNGLYFYVVNAFNAAGTSANSNQASATVATAAAATISPSTLSFGPITVGFSTAAQSVTLTNTGNATLSSITVNTPSGPNAPDFAISGNNCGATLGVGLSCGFNVIFTPSIIGPEAASIVITSNDPNSPDTVSLSGSGTAALTISPTSLNFGNVYIKKISSAQVVTYTNLSGVAITFTSVLVSGGDSTQFVKGANTCTGSLASGATCTVSVTFQPSTVGTKNSTLVFTDSTSGSPRSITLTGVGNSHHVLKVGAVVGFKFKATPMPRLVRI